MMIIILKVSHHWLLLGFFTLDFRCMWEQAIIQEGAVCVQSETRSQQ